MCFLQSQEMTNKIGNDISGRQFLGERVVMRRNIHALHLATENGSQKQHV